MERISREIGVRVLIMKSHLILLSTLMCAVGAMRSLHGQQRTADEVVAAMVARDALRERASGGYRGDREYQLQSHVFQKGAEMLVKVNCEQDGTKYFEVISEAGWKSANNRVLREMLAAESDSSYPDTRPKSRITSDNYIFQMIEAGFPLEGRASYVIDVVPKRQDKSLFRGRIWVDAEDYALARVEGEPAKNLSFWTRKVHFVQRYRKDGDYWFPAMTTSVTDARMFGATDVNIRYFDYKPISAAPTSIDHTSMEAYNDGH
jgi:hypothetical protein